MASPRLNQRLEYGGVLIMLAALWLTTATHSHFSQDSWSYFELSKTIFTDFYKVNTWRQFHLSPGDYGTSFPPLWPVIIGVFNGVLGVGIYTGFILNFAITLLNLYLLRRLAAHFTGNLSIGSFWALGLLVMPDYTTALFSGGTLPLALAFTFILLLLQLDRTFDELTICRFSGIIAGLGVLTRFDFLPFALVFALAPFLLGQRMQWIKLFVFMTTFAITISPWMAYSMHYFNDWFISDNGRTFLSAVPIFVRDYYPDGVPLLSNDPVGWANKTMHAMLTSMAVMMESVGVLPFLVILAAVLTGRGRKLAHKKLLGVYTLAIVAQLLLILASGFVESRYYVPLQLCLLIIISAMLFTRPLPRYTSLLFLTISIAYAGAYIAKSTVQKAPIAIAFNPEFQKPLEFEHLLKNCVDEKSRVLLPPKNYSYKFGALTGITSYVAPTNLSRDNITAFRAEFKPTHILTDVPDELGFKGKPDCKVNSWGEVAHEFYLFKLSQPR